MSQFELDEFFENIVNYLKTPRGQDNLKEIFSIITMANQTSHTQYEVKEINSKEKLLIQLIREIENTSSNNPTLIILKNENDLFDMYIFKQEISVTYDDVSSSEKFFAKVRNKKLTGRIIPDIPFYSLFTFLKAYYIHRGKVEINQTSNNPAYEYNNNCLEMQSTTDLFADIDKQNYLRLNNCLIYSDDALPYSLDYLDDYIENHTYFSKPMDFEIVFKDVKEDKYGGTTLSKFIGWL